MRYIPHEFDYQLCATIFFFGIRIAHNKRKRKEKTIEKMRKTRSKTNPLLIPSTWGINNENQCQRNKDEVRRKNNTQIHF